MPIKYLQSIDFIVDTDQLRAAFAGNPPKSIRNSELEILEATDQTGSNNYKLLRQLDKNNTPMSRNMLKVVKSGIKKKFKLKQI